MLREDDIRNAGQRWSLSGERTSASTRDLLHQSILMEELEALAMRSGPKCSLCKKRAWEAVARFLQSTNKDVYDVLVRIVE